MPRKEKKEILNIDLHEFDQSSLNSSCLIYHTTYKYTEKPQSRTQTTNNCTKIQHIIVVLCPFHFDFRSFRFSQLSISLFSQVCIQVVFLRIPFHTVVDLQVGSKFADLEPPFCISASKKGQGVCMTCWVLSKDMSQISLHEM